ncbi:MAG: hypothetical protein LC778_08160 [Acidobacteria bacterium]|nr:hypothetical protein [Acidobacteriota bacterium]
MISVVRIVRAAVVAMFGLLLMFAGMISQHRVLENERRQVEHWKGEWGIDLID